MKILEKFKSTETPYGTFKYLFYNCIRFYASACGSDISNPTFRYSMRTFLLVASTIMFTLISCHTIYALEDYSDKVKCLITFPLGVQVSQNKRAK